MPINVNQCESMPINANQYQSIPYILDYIDSNTTNSSSGKPIPNVIILRFK